MRRVSTLSALWLGATLLSACPAARAPGAARTRDPANEESQRERLRARAERAFVAEGLSPPPKAPPTTAGDGAKPAVGSAPAAAAGDRPAPANVDALEERGKGAGCKAAGPHFECDVDVSIAAGEHESPAEVMLRAKEAARRLAVERVSGVRVSSRFFHVQQLAGAENRQIVDRLTSIVSEAMVLEDSVVSQRQRSRAGSLGYDLDATVRCKVAKLNRQADPGFQVNVSTNRSVYVAGDVTTITISSSRDGYLYLFSVGPDGDVTVLVPNEYMPSQPLRAGEKFVFPTAELTKRKVVLTAELPPGKKQVAERVKALVLRKNIDLLPAGAGQSAHAAGKSLLISEILARLVRSLDPDDWRDDVAAYTITAR